MNLIILLTSFSFKAVIANYCKIDIADPESHQILNPKRGTIGPVELVILKSPDKYTFQILVDGKDEVYRAGPTEAIREVIVYYSNGNPLCLYMYSLDYFAAPRETFYMMSRGAWRRVGKDRFDSAIFDSSMESDLGSFLAPKTGVAVLISLLALALF